VRTVHATVLAASLYLAGCSSTPVPLVSNVFDDLTNETVGKSTLAIEYRSFLSLSGLAPVQSLGMLVHHPASVSPTHAIGISPKWSFAVASTYEADKITEAKIAAVEPAYLTLQEIAGRMAASSSTVGLARAALNRKDYRIAAEVLGLFCEGECVAEINAEMRRLLKETDTLRDRLIVAKREFAQLTNLKNVVFMRWTFHNDETTSLSAGQTVTLRERNRQGKSGLAIFAGLRVLTVYFGEDFLDAAGRYRTFGEKVAFTQSSILSHEVQVGDVKYLSDSQVSTAFELSLKITQGRLAQLKSLLGLDEIPDIGVDYASALLSDVGNRGFLSKPKVEAKPYCFFPPRTHQDYIVWGLDDSDGYSTVYAVKSQVSLVAAFMLSSPLTDLQAIMTNANLTDPDRESLLAQYEHQCGGPLERPKAPRTDLVRRWSIFDRNVPPFGRWTEHLYPASQ
jgi:hypothetical protein